jgi:hypothetical protein
LEELDADDRILWRVILKTERGRGLD